MPFDFTNNTERTLFESFANESIKIFGLDVIYYVTTFNSTKEPIYDEDTKPKVTGEYKVKMWMETIQEDWILSRFGLMSNDFLKIYIDIKEFLYSIGDFEPKPGDYIWINYMNRLFVVTDIDKEDNIFHQKKMVYGIKISAANIQGEEIDTTLETLTNYENVHDNQNDNTSISVAASGIVKNKIGDTSIFGIYE